MATKRTPYKPLLPQFAIIIEKNGVELSRDILSAADSASAKETFLSLTVERFFDPSDESLECRVEQVDARKPQRARRPLRRL
jgi:hypothetical protein